MSDVELGKTFYFSRDRDAVHVAIVALKAMSAMYRAQPFILVPGTTDTAMPTPNGLYIGALGVVDPFLEIAIVEKGNWFWGFLRPGTISGLRHHWKHRAFDEEVQEDHRQWLFEFCSKWRIDFDDLIDAAAYKSGEERLAIANGKDLHGAEDLGAGVADDVWRHIEGYLGKKFSEKHREGLVWSCTC